MNKLLIAFLASLTLLSGCATRQPISQADKVAVTAVVVNKTVSVPEKMYYLGPGGATGLMFGAIGGALAAPGIESSRADFQSKIGESEVTIRTIVLEEMLSKFRESGKFPLAESSPQDATTLNISITQYGFSIPHGFSSSLVPILRITCELKNSSGRVLWSETSGTMPLGNPVESIPADIVQKNVSTRNAAWRGAAKAIAKNIVDSY